MRKNKNIFALVATAFALVVTGCGGQTPTYRLLVDQDEGVDKVQIFEGETEVTDLTHVEEGTELSAVITLKDDYETTAVTFDGETLTAVSGEYNFTMPDNDATLTIKTAEIINTFALTVQKDEGVEAVKVFAGTTEVNDLNAIAEGTTLTLEVTTKANYGLKEVRVGEQVLTATDGKYAYTMPSANATVSVTTEKLAASVTVTNDLAKGTFTLTANGEAVTDGACHFGDAMKLVVTTANENVRVKSLTVDGTEVAYPESGYEFTVSKESYAITINYEEFYTLTAVESIVNSMEVDLSLSSGETTYEVGDSILVGTQLTLTISSN